MFVSAASLMVKDLSSSSKFLFKDVNCSSKVSGLCNPGMKVHNPTLRPDSHLTLKYFSNTDPDRL